MHELTAHTFRLNQTYPLFHFGMGFRATSPPPLDIITTCEGWRLLARLALYASGFLFFMISPLLGSGAGAIGG